MNINGFAVPVLKNHIAHFKAIRCFFRFLPSFYVSVKLAIFCYWMPPKLTTATRLLAFFEFYPLFLLIFWQLHREKYSKSPLEWGIFACNYLKKPICKCFIKWQAYLFTPKIKKNAHFCKQLFTKFTF